MQRLIALLAVAALAAIAWWIAATVSSGPAEDMPAPGPAAGEQGLTVHVFVADREGKPVTPAQVVQVYSEARTKVDAKGYARLEGVLLRADEAPSDEAFAVALKPLARHHALRRGFTPKATKREDGSWEVRYALHAYGILRVHVEAVDLGTCKAFLERDEPLRRWEPVGGHAVVRPGSVVDFRIYEGWDAPGWSGTVPVRLEGEAGSDGIVSVATRRVMVDAPSPGHTAQLTLVPEPVDPILGVVRVKEGPPPPTLRGRVLVHQLEDAGSKTFVGTVPIDDEGSFTIRDAGARAYEIVAGLDFAPGLITTKTKGGDYLELETPGRARWVELTGTGAGTYWPLLKLPEGRAVTTPLPETIEDVLTRSWWTRHRTPWSRHLEEREVLSRGWQEPPLHVREGVAAVALPGPGAWKLWIRRKGTSEAMPAASGWMDIDVPTNASRLEAGVAWRETRSGRVVVDVDPKGWGHARSVLLELGSIGKRTVVKGGRMRAVFEHLPAQEPEASMSNLTATWDDPSIAPLMVPATASSDADPTPVRVRARPGEPLELHLGGATAARLAMDVVLVLDTLKGPGRTEFVFLERRGSAPVWRSTHGVPPGVYQWEMRLRADVDVGSAGRRERWLRLDREAFENTPETFEVTSGKSTVLSWTLPSK